jgi:hypothetical protein
MNLGQVLRTMLKKMRVSRPSLPGDSRSAEVEMTKDEVIERTLMGMELYWSWGQRGVTAEEVEHARSVVAQIQNWLPDTQIKTCAAFGDLNTPCCQTCHTFSPDHHMYFIDLPDGTSAWVCCALARAVCLDLNKQAAHSPEARLLEDIFGADGIQKI